MINYKKSVGNTTVEIKFSNVTELLEYESTQSPSNVKNLLANQFIKTDLNTLDLSVRANNMLISNKILTVGELCKLSMRDLLKMDGIGKKTANEIKDELKKIAIEL